MKNWLRISFLAALISNSASPACAQVQTAGWLASFNTFGLHPRLSLHLDVQLRSSDALEGVQSLLVRPGLNVHLSKAFWLTAGYAWIENRRTAGAATGYLSEHRAWQQALFQHKWNRLSSAHRLRFEQRFIPQALTNGTELSAGPRDLAWRLRYFTRHLLPFGITAERPHGPFAALQNEVFLNTGNLSVVNGSTFDQNRLYGALGYRWRKMDLEAGYLYQYVKQRSTALHNHVVQLAVYKRL